MAKRPSGKQRAGEDPVQSPAATSIIPIEHVQSKILLIRGQKVILDADLAALYGVTTARLNEQVKRNIERFPPDFAFRLIEDEFGNLKSHLATSSSGWGGRRKLPYAFTEHGAIMAASVLNSERAVQLSVVVVRAQQFVGCAPHTIPPFGQNETGVPCTPYETTAYGLHAFGGQKYVVPTIATPAQGDNMESSYIRNGSMG